MLRRVRDPLAQIRLELHDGPVHARDLIRCSHAVEVEVDVEHPGEDLLPIVRRKPQRGRQRTRRKRPDHGREQIRLALSLETVEEAVDGRWTAVP